MLESITGFKNLARCETLRAIYSIPVSLNVGELRDKALFDAARSNSCAEARIKKGRLKWSPKIIGKAFKECSNIAVNHQRQILSKLPDNWSFAFDTDLSPQGREEHQAMHPEKMHLPKTVMYFCANKAGTFIVSHQDTLEILEDSPMADLLDCRFSDFERPTELADAFQFSYDYFGDSGEKIPGKIIYDRLRERATQIDPYTVAAITGATLHFRPESIPPGRVFFRGCAPSEWAYS